MMIFSFFKDMTRVLSFFGIALGAAFAANAQQSDPTQSYSATAIHAVPGQPETMGRVVKAGEDMRLEFEQNGQTVIQILRPEQGLMLILDPSSNTYMELKGAQMPVGSGRESAVPCSNQSGMAVCQKVGVDTVSGIQVERWLLAAQPNTTPISVLWDPTRRHALRQDFPDGSSTALNFVAMEEINGRPAEHWGLRISARGQETLTGGWWFDPEIRVVVREELPGGEVRRLENILVGDVDPGLFEVPQGWAPKDDSTIATPLATGGTSN